MPARWTLDHAPRQSGTVAVVTGANAGLGLEIARGLVQLDATVVLACRNLAKAEAARASLLDEHPDGHVEIVHLDLADLDSVAAAAHDVTERFDRLDLLVNNAGLMALDASRTAQGFEMQFGVNHLGHFALTIALLPKLLATPGSRVVTMSSMGHRAGRLRLDDLHGDARGYGRWRAYFQSKLANILFTAALDERLRAMGASTIALAAHPGASNTDLGTEGHGLTNRVMAIVPFVAQPASVGALPALRAALDPDASGGEFYGPRWIVRGRPVRETPSRRARRIDDARALWTASEELTGYRFDASASPARRDVPDTSAG